MSLFAVYLLVVNAMHLGIPAPVSGDVHFLQGRCQQELKLAEINHPGNQFACIKVPFVL